MQELMYLLRVPQEEGVAEVLQELLVCAAPPQYVRLSTLAPLSNYGFPPGSEGALLAVSDTGLVVGVLPPNQAPHTLVPWQNIAYLAESGGLERGEGVYEEVT